MPSRLQLRVPYNSQLIIKKSRFLAQAIPLISADSFDAFLTTHIHPAASHNPWAFSLLGSPSNSPHTRCSDDGEPAGTAGRPILAAIQAAHVDNVGVLVVRYFGGVKLGVGGLRRAYYQAAAQCLKEADKVWVEDVVRVRVNVAWEGVGGVMRVADKLERIDGGFDEVGGWVVVQVARDVIADVVAEFRNACRGMGKVIVLKEDEDAAGGDNG